MDGEQLTFVFDIDGTICPIKEKHESYSELIPYPQIVAKMRQYKNDGAKIVLFTSRNMNSYGGNIGLINVNTAPVLLEWLKKWDIPFDEVIFGKPWPGHNGFYVDDRTIRPDEFLGKSIDELNQLCAHSRSKVVE